MLVASIHPSKSSHAVKLTVKEKSAHGLVLHDQFIVKAATRGMQLSDSHFLEVGR